MKRKIIVCILSLCLLAGLLPAASFAAESAKWDGTVAEDFAGGSGTAEDPYQIANGAQMALVGKQADDGDTEGLFYVLTKDIDLGNKPWTPIGTERLAYCKFEGTFDGGYHLVSGLNVDAGPDDTGNGGDTYAGLFGNVRGGNILNLAVSGTVRVSGVKHAIAGGVAGAVSKEAQRPSDPGGLISNCSFTGSVTAKAEPDYGTASATAGGIAGLGSSTGILNCRNDGTVTCESTHNVYAGGIVGQGSFTAGCVNTGDVTGISEAPDSSSSSNPSNYVGGVVGSNSSTYSPNDIENCLNTGDVTARGGYACAGGVVGRNYIKSGYNDYSTLISCGSTGAVTGGDKARAGGLVGCAWVGSYTEFQNCYSAGPVTAGDGGWAGGVLGYADGAASSGRMEACYSCGPVTGGADAEVGGVIGEWQVTRSSEAGCFYLRTETVNSELEGIARGSSWIEGGDEIPALSAEDFGKQDSFDGWDWDVWKMAEGLDPEVCSVTARPVLVNPDESAKEVPVMGVSLDERTLTLLVGETAKLTATVVPEAAADRTVQWGSSAGEVATVNEKGVVTAVAEGTAEIAAAAGDRGAVCKVEVVPARIGEITEDGDTITVPVFSGSDGTAFLAAYTWDGRCLTAAVQPLEAGAEARLSLDLTDYTYCLRAFVVDKDLRPLIPPADIYSAE